MNKDKAIETLETSFNAFDRLSNSERIELEYRLRKTKQNNKPQDYEEMSRLCHSIAKHMEQKEDFEFSISVLKNTDRKYRGIDF